jgi:hypothetical protein
MLRFRGPALNRDLNRRLVLEELEPRTLLAVSIQFDYSLDDQGFFNSQTRRTLLQSVADSISDHFTDTLDAVGTRTWTISDPANFTNTVSVTRSVPADTIVVYVGGSNLSGNTVGQGGSTWLTNHRGEGNGSTDFGPALGYLTFSCMPLASAWPLPGTISSPTARSPDRTPPRPTVGLHLPSLLGVTTSINPSTPS